MKPIMFRGINMWILIIFYGSYFHLKSVKY